MEDKMQTNIKVLLSLSAITLIMFFQNCSKTDFTRASAGVAINTGNGAGSGDDSGGGTNSGATNNGDTTNQDITVNNNNSNFVPKYKIFIDHCEAGQYCKAHVVLNEKAKADYKFDWVTDDTMYLTDSLKYAKPNFHYVPNRGSVTIKIGEERTALTVKSINWSFKGEKDSIIIPLIISNCNYGGTFYSCEEIRDKTNDPK